MRDHQNAILARVSLQDLAAIWEFLDPTILSERIAPHVYFIESGLVSLRIAAAGSVLETAGVGYRGVIVHFAVRGKASFEVLIVTGMGAHLAMASLACNAA
ncbi:hypothetical protein H8A99_36975 [Bradyrhizobium sp. Arg68]|uniref:hypothetical protein n=1 Tax=Bradyrhizobium ivorense TaxID=2511166 RepID=UPI001E36C03C|nr:hypothetical protein [Bradyrhizobium ivorense]MCC8941874.1 hypothetical protein [Bradyrhizobium ivorense]